MQEVVEALGKVVSDDILQQVKASPFLAILADETTDIAVFEQPIFYVRYLSDEGEIKFNNHFLEHTNFQTAKSKQ